MVVLTTVKSDCIRMDTALRQFSKRLLFQRRIILLLRQCKVCDCISEVVLIDACQGLTQPAIPIQEECGCSPHIQVDHQFLQDEIKSFEKTENLSMQDVDNE